MNLKMKNYIYLTTTKQTSLKTKTKTKTWKIGSRDVSKPRLKSPELH